MNNAALWNSIEMKSIMSKEEKWPKLGLLQKFIKKGLLCIIWLISIKEVVLRLMTWHLLDTESAMVKPPLNILLEIS